ncbi:MAG: molybdenum cofactor biosynthesis protein MoaE [Gemmatimonadetes bacterium]|nr:molybdenum cofactor biosynthesis protein MoaE [Gemmatimonadota bacterium]
MILAEVSSDPIDTAALLAKVGSNEDGAALLFIGVVRDHAEGRKVTGMRYDVYAEMATEVLREIALEASIPLGTDRIAVAHRFGELKIGEISVGIAVSSPHRAEAYEASRFVIEEIKKRLPVWKKEHYVDGVSEWVEGTIPPSAGLEDSTHVAPLTDEGLA